MVELFVVPRGFDLFEIYIVFRAAMRGGMAFVGPFGLLGARLSLLFLGCASLHIPELFAHVFCILFVLMLFFFTRVVLLFLMKVVFCG